MASKIIDTQVNFSRKFAESGKAVADLLQPTRHNATAPSSIRPRYINVPTASLDSNVTVDIPSVAYLGDLYATFQLPSATGDYADYPGLNIIKTVKLTHGGNTIHEYDYRSVMSSIMSGLSSEQHASILDAAGGDPGADGAGVYVAPIPTFWSRIAHGGKFTFPLAYHLFRGDMQLELTLRPAAEFDDGGAGVALSSMRLHFLEYDTTTDQKRSHANDRASYVYYSVDWTTDVDNATGTAETDIDISGMRGGLTRLSISTVDDTGYDAGARYLEVAHDSLVVRADGEDLVKFEPQTGESAARELEYVNLLMGHSEANATLNSASNLYFDIVGHSEASRHYSGHLNADAINNLTVSVIAAAAGTRTDVVGWRDALFVYDNGQLRKQV